jgi:predicted permease
MKSLRAWTVRLIALFRTSRAERDLQAEIDSHLQLQTDDNIRAGMSPEAARRAAVLRMGGVERVKEAQRDRAGVPYLQNLGRDVRYAFRILARNPTFSAVTVLTLALGVGANTAIFTFVNAVLLRPLPYADADRLVMLWGTDTESGSREVSISYPDFETWRTDTRNFEQVAALTTRPAALGGGDQPELVPSVQTTPDFFRLLRVDARLGRTFVESDGAPDAPAAAVLSDAAWTRLFGGRRDVVGMTVTVNQRPHVVIGVVPAAMHLIPAASEQVYTLLPREADRQHLYLRTIARLRPGATLEAGQAELDVVTRRIAAAFPRTNGTTGANVVPLASVIGAPVRDGLLILLALVGAVLLIACTNVANLLLARNASREPELALRMSLGASRGRILQQLLAESVVLAMAGGAAGLLLGGLLTGALVAMFDGVVPIPGLERVRIDTTVLGFAFAISVLAGCLFGVIPARIAAPGRVHAAARDTGRTVAGSRGGRRTRAALVVLETALALVLLAASAMLTRAFLELRATAPGFVADDVLAVGVRLPPTLPPGARREAFFDQVREGVTTLPGVRAAGFVSSLPMAGDRDSLQFRVLDQPGAKPVSANFNIASPGYFRAMRIPVSRGREFSASDNATGPAAIVINETAAQRFWPGMDPLGRRIAITGEPTEFTVVGITGDVRQSDFGSAPSPEIFLSALQDGPDWAGFALVVHTAGDPLSLVPGVRAALRTADGAVAIAKVGTMDDVLAGRLAEPRIYTSLLGGFAVLALALAAVGLYGVIAYSVARQTRELGIRLALGSSPSALVAGVMREGAGLTAIGIVIGLAGAYAATQGVAALLPGARPGDPLTLGGVAGLMLLVGALAAYVPARRAARVDPLTALRAE